MAWLQLGSSLVIACNTTPSVRAPLTADARRFLSSRPTPATWEAMGLLRTGSALAQHQEANLHIAATPERSTELTVRTITEVLRQGVYHLKVEKDELTGEIEVVTVGVPSGFVAAFHVTAIRQGLSSVMDWKRAVPTYLVDILESDEAIRVSSVGSLEPDIHHLDSERVGDTLLDNQSVWSFAPEVDLRGLLDLAGAIHGCAIRPTWPYRADEARDFDRYYRHANARPEHLAAPYVREWVARLEGDTDRARVQRRFLYASSQAAFTVLFGLSIHYLNGGETDFDDNGPEAAALRVACRLVQQRTQTLGLLIPTAASRYMGVPLPYHMLDENLIPLDLQFLPRYEGECSYFGLIIRGRLPGNQRPHNWATCNTRRRRRAAVLRGFIHRLEVECGYPFCFTPQGPHLPAGCEGARMLCPLCGLRGHPPGVGCTQYDRAELITIHAVIQPLLHPNYRSSLAWNAASASRTARHRLQFMQGAGVSRWVEPCIAEACAELLTLAEVDEMLLERDTGSVESALHHFGVR